MLNLSIYSNSEDNKFLKFEIFEIWNFFSTITLWNRDVQVMFLSENSNGGSAIHGIVVSKPINIIKKHKSTFSL